MTEFSHRRDADKILSLFDTPAAVYFHGNKQWQEFMFISYYLIIATPDRNGAKASKPAKRTSLASRTELLLCSANAPERTAAVCADAPKP